VDELLALSFLQPWLWAILEGYKPIENRTWKPWPKAVGRRLALHASLGWDARGAEFVDEVLVQRVPPVEALPKAGIVRGGIVGTARVVGALQVDAHERLGYRPLLTVRGSVGPPGFREEREKEILASPWSFGPWCWFLADVRKLREPVEARGTLGLWDVPPDVAARVRELEVTP
jgi:hypothetical protein